MPARKKRADENGQPRKPVNEHLYNSLKNKAERHGAVILRGSDDVHAHLESRGVLASSVGDIIMLRADATTSEVLEEFFHLEQHWRNDYSELPNKEMQIRREIDAQMYLIRVARRYNIPSEETSLTLRNLRDYQKQLEDLLNADKRRTT